MTDDALIHLRVPAPVKGRWVRASRAAGMRLTDWIVQAVEANMTNHAQKNYYAVQTEGNGTTLWKFASRVERDEWVGANVRRASIPAADAARMMERPSPGHYVRWGRPEFARQ